MISSGHTSSVRRVATGTKQRGVSNINNNNNSNNNNDDDNNTNSKKDKWYIYIYIYIHGDSVARVLKLLSIKIMLLR